MNSELTLRDKTKLMARFYAFKKERDDLNLFLVSFIADYTMLQNDDPSKRKRYLRKKYGLRTPRINYRFNTGEGFCWSVRNIAIVLGRDRSAITRVISRIIFQPQNVIECILETVLYVLQKFSDC